MIDSEDRNLMDWLNVSQASIQPLARATGFEAFTGDAEGMVAVVFDGGTAYLPLAELVDKQAEIDRLTKERERLEKELKRSAGMLKNENFLKKAPEAKVQEEKEKQARYQEMMEQVEKQLAALK